MAITAKSIHPGIARQQAYLDNQAATGADDGIIVGSAFVNGIRDLGYKNTATALDELVDNSEQAGATSTHLVFECAESSKPNHVTAIAVVDDGYGMLPGMIASAAKWGGTDRENDRQGFGRYGYGLPSSCVSQGERFRIFSRIDGGEFHTISVDLQEIRQGKFTIEGGRIASPGVKAGGPPKWVQKYIDEHFNGLPHGTVIVIDKLDRLKWVTRKGLRENLISHMGIIYRNYLRTMSIVVDGTKVEPVDPLFLTPGCRGYDVDEQRAEGKEPIVIDVKTEDGNSVGSIKVRAAYLPIRFGFVDKDTDTKTKQNARMSIMEEHEGMIILRNGRQIDVVNRSGWGRGKTWRNEDRYWQVEIDFSPVLDEEFSVTTSKQTVQPSERIWEHLRLAGVEKLISAMKDQQDRERSDLKARVAGEPGAKRPSEQAMEDAAKFKAKKPTAEQVERFEKSQEAIEVEAQRKSEETGVPKEEIKKILLLDTQRRPWALEFESASGAPFYRPELAGSQRRIYLNKAHPFYTQLYAGPGSTEQTRAALEVLLFVLGDGEVEAFGERQEFYERERGFWSDQLKTALKALAKRMPEAPGANGDSADEDAVA